MVAYLRHMKGVALILLTCFSFFMFQPAMYQMKGGCHTETTYKMSCCHKECKTPPAQPKSSCPAPFYCPFCGAGGGFVVTKTITSPVALAQVKEIEHIYTQSLASQFVCECWQPPENTACLLG
jgi:hypothetical protein